MDLHFGELFVPLEYYFFKLTFGKQKKRFQVKTQVIQNFEVALWLLYTIN